MPSNRKSGSRHRRLSTTRSIEADDFPFEFLSEVAEAESWRKEIYRPIYHVHKWWAQRLGSVFRAIILGSAPTESTTPLMKRFYERVDLDGLVVLDPFMGSGTTVGEAAKLGCAAVGRDINPVAFNAVRVALGPLDRRALDDAFRAVETAVGAELRALYRSVDSAGRQCDVLYFFWVKVTDCPECDRAVDLFSSYIFAKNAYVKKHPTVHVLCRNCGAVFKGLHHDTKATCGECGCVFDPHSGPAKHTTAVCKCGHEFQIARTVRGSGRPPRHRLYAKLVLNADGEKEYLRATAEDQRLFERACKLAVTSELLAPEGALEPGYNTKQALNYNYRRWSDFFNGRQLLALGLLAKAIHNLPAGPARDALAIVFSGALEFNNLFASYKGEGTGAVRHMFSHHILKPERTPIEANPWGLPQSSGSFSTLYRGRLLRALDYRERPFEVAPESAGERVKGSKVFGTSGPLTSLPLHGWTARPRAPGLYLSCGDSGATGLASKSVDLVVTDPPFYDNVHYSELADFFHAWQRKLLPVDVALSTTRQEGEVQDSSADAFATKLGRVFAECHRVLVDDGLLVFSYHHSRDDGWISVAQALCEAGFAIVQAHPVKAEMSVAAPKAQASDPIDLDILMICRKKSDDVRPALTASAALKAAHNGSVSRLARFLARGRRLSRNDVKVLLFSRLLVEISGGRSSDEIAKEFERLVPKLQVSIDTLFDDQEVPERIREDSPPQLRLGFFEGRPAREGNAVAKNALP